MQYAQPAPQEVVTLGGAVNRYGFNVRSFRTEYHLSLVSGFPNRVRG